MIPPLHPSLASRGLLRLAQLQDPTSLPPALVTCGSAPVEHATLGFLARTWYGDEEVGAAIDAADGIVHRPKFHVIPAKRRSVREAAVQQAWEMANTSPCITGTKHHFVITDAQCIDGRTASILKTIAERRHETSAVLLICIHPSTVPRSLRACCCEIRGLRPRHEWDAWLQEVHPDATTSVIHDILADPRTVRDPTAADLLVGASVQKGIVPRDRLQDAVRDVRARLVELSRGGGNAGAALAMARQVARAMVFYRIPLETFAIACAAAAEDDATAWWTIDVAHKVRAVELDDTYRHNLIAYEAFLLHMVHDMPQRDAAAPEREPTKDL